MNPNAKFIEDACPEKELLMRVAWRDCLIWTIGSKDPDFLKVFTEDTGVSLPPPPRNGLDAMIDNACGISEEFATAYVAWFNVSVWGLFKDPLIDVVNSLRVVKS